MANPQKEAGFTQFPNRLLLAMVSTKQKLSGADFRVLLWILNQTAGYHREKRRMSATYIANATGLSVRQVRRSLANLQRWNMIRLYPAENATNVLGINDTPEEWATPDSPVTPDKPVTVTALTESPDTPVTVPPDKSVTQNKKEKQEREYKKEDSTCPFFETLWAAYPNKKGKAKVTQKARREMARLGYEKMHRALERYKAEKPDWQHWQNGSTFFNGGYLDYLDEPAGKEQTNETDGTNGAGADWERIFAACKV